MDDFSVRLWVWKLKYYSMLEGDDYHVRRVCKDDVLFMCVFFPCLDGSSWIAMLCFGFHFYYILAYNVNLYAVLNLSESTWQVIFYEQDWNPQADKQAVQRAHRIGQVNPVLAINLVAEDTIDEVLSSTCTLYIIFSPIVCREGAHTPSLFLHPRRKWWNNNVHTLGKHCNLYFSHCCFLHLNLFDLLNNFTSNEREMNWQASIQDSIQMSLLGYLK